MKIIINNICYVESTDIKFLKALKKFDLKEKPIIIDTSMGTFEKYELNESINFFKYDNYILDYDRVKDMSISQIEHFILINEIQLTELFKNQIGSLNKNNNEEKIKFEFKIMQIKYLIESIKKYKNFKLSYDIEINFLTKEEKPKTYNFKLKK